MDLSVVDDRDTLCVSQSFFDSLSYFLLVAVFLNRCLELFQSIFFDLLTFNTNNSIDFTASQIFLLESNVYFGETAR